MTTIDIRGGEIVKKTVRGFTLVELLVVIAIVAILAAVVVLIVNPLELTRRSRDAARLTDLANLQQAINVALQEGTAAGQASPACNSNTPGATCGPYLTSATTGPGASRATNGTGWVAVNFAGQSNVVVPTLPIDPTNTGVTGTLYHYTYCGNGVNWKILTRLESSQQSSKAGSDGGLYPTEYEVGSDMQLACAY